MAITKCPRRYGKVPSEATGNGYPLAELLSLQILHHHAQSAHAEALFETFMIYRKAVLAHAVVEPLLELPPITALCKIWFQ